MTRRRTSCAQNSCVLYLEQRGYDAEKKRLLEEGWSLSKRPLSAAKRELGQPALCGPIADAVSREPHQHSLQTVAFPGYMHKLTTASE